MSKQTILGRVAQLAKASINAPRPGGGSPEDAGPADPARLLANITAGGGGATTIGNLRLLEQDHREDVDAAKEWGEKALAASRKADELPGGELQSAAESRTASTTWRRGRVGRQLSRRRARIGKLITAQTEVVEKLKAASTR